ncbi:TPA: phage tail family protein [Salmonella enterica subsp. enterica serovar Typhi str. AG3]|nr:phage tail family protein [Salmonella enterica subsp. enterica serovar Typhi str. AG3]
MIIKELKITNSSGDSIEFGRHFRLIDGFDLSALSATVNTSPNTGNGARYKNTKLETRDLDSSFFINRDNNDNEWIEAQREELFKVLNPLKNPMRLDFTTKGGKELYLNAELLSAPSLPQGFENDNRAWQKGLLQFTCSDPYIYDAAEIKVDIALWVSNLEFPLEVVEEGIEVGYRSPSLIVNVLNEGSDSSGMTIRFTALSEVVNPKLLNVNTYDELKLNTIMQPGDVIEVSTYRGKRTVKLIRNNVESNAFNTVDLYSKWLQLEVGDNLFRYDADEGLDYLEVSIKYTPKRIGV